MATISIKIFLVDLGSVKTCQYATDMFVTDIIKDVRAKHNYGEGGLDHGLLFKEQGLWLSPNKMLGHYDLKFGDVLEFRKKHRILKVKTLDSNVKNILIDESINIRSIVEVICQRIGLANPEEYSLIKDEREEPATSKKEKDKDKKKNEVKTDAHGWLNPEKTLREHGLGEEDFVILKKKFFVTDQNVDRTDPVQLVMMYTQAYDMVISGKIPCTMEEAAQFGGIAMQIKYGNQDPERHKPGFAKMKELVPPEYVKNKDVEKGVYREHSILQGTTELNAKFRYVQLIRSLKSYGTSFFLVKEPADKAKKKKAETMLLGITKQAVVRMTIETKQIISEWKLTHLRRWAATPKTFTLDFGDYSESYYQFETEEGEEISRLIAGYIEILVKKRNQLATVIPEQAVEEKAVIEEYVRPEKSSKVAIVTNQAAPKQARSLLSPQPGAGVPMSTAVDPRTKGAIAENFETVEAQEMILRLIKNGLDSLNGSLRDLGMPLQLPVMKSDPSSEQWRNETSELNSEALAAHIANLMSAVAALLQNANGKVEEMDYDKLGVKLVTTIGSISQSAQALRVLSAISDDDRQDELIEAGKAMIEATCSLLQELQPVVTGHKILIDMHNAANNLANKCTDVLMIVDQVPVSEVSQSELLAAASDVGNALVNLTNIAKAAQGSLKNDESKKALLKRLEDSNNLSNSINATTGVLASVIAHPVCREQLIDCAIDIRDLSQSLGEFQNELSPELVDQLQKAIMDTEDALAYLVERAKTVDSSLDSDIGLYNSHVIAICEEMADNVDDKEALFGCAKELTVNATRLVECLKQRAQQIDNEEESLNLQDDAKKLAELTALMVGATRNMICNPSVENRNELLNTLDDIKELASGASAPYSRSNLIQTLARVFKGALGSSNLLVAAAQQSSLTNRDRNSQMALNKLGKAATELIPRSVKAIKSYKKDPNNQVSKLKMIEKAKQFLRPAEELANAGKVACPNISDASAKAQLLSLSNILGEEVALLSSLLDEEAAGFDGAELKIAIQHVQVQEDQFSPTLEGPMDIPLVESKLMEKANNFNQVFQNISDMMNQKGSQGQLRKVSTSLASLNDETGLEVRSALTNAIAEFQTLKGIISCMAADEKTNLKHDLLEASGLLGDVLEKLVTEVGKGSPKKERMEELVKEANEAVTTVLGNLPRQKAMNEALGTIKVLTSQLERSGKLSSLPSPTESQSHPKLTIPETSDHLHNEVVTAVGDLTAATQALVNMSKSNPAALKENIQNLEKSFGRLIEMAETIPPDEGQQQVGHAVHKIGLECDRLLNALQANLLSSSENGGKSDLVDAAAGVSDIVNDLLGLFSNSNKAYEQYSKAVQILNAAANKVAEVNLPKSKTETFADAQFWTQHGGIALKEKLQSLEANCENNDLNDIVSEAVKLAEGVQDLVNHATAGAHLLGLLDSQSSPAIPAPIDFNAVNAVVKDSKLILTKAAMKGNNTASLYEDAMLLSKNADKICSLLKPAIADSNTDNAIKADLKKAVSELAGCTTRLVQALKNSMKDTPEKNTGIFGPVGENIRVLEKIESLLRGSNLAGIPAKPSHAGILLQTPVLDGCNTVISEAQNILNSIQPMFREGPAPKDEIFESVKKLGNSAEQMIEYLKSAMPAQTECKKAKSGIEQSVSAIKSAIRGIERGSAVQDISNGDFVALGDSINGVVDLSHQILADIRKNPQQGVKQIPEMAERFELVAKSVVGVTPSIRDSHKVPVLNTTCELGKALNRYVDQFQNYIIEENEIALVQLENETANLEDVVKQLNEGLKNGDMRDPSLQLASKEIEVFVKEFDERTATQTLQAVPVSQIATLIDQNGQTMVKALNQIAASKDSEDVGKLAEMTWNTYQSIGTSVAAALKQTDDDDVRSELKKLVKDLGSTALDAVQSLQQMKTSNGVDPVAKAKLNQATKEFAAKLNTTNTLVNRVTTGVAVCENTIATVDQIIEELDQTINFARAKHLNPVSGTDSFANHKDQLMASAKKMVDVANSLSNSNQLPQEALATLVTSAADILQELKIKVSQSSASLSSAEAEMQEKLLETAKNLGLAMRSLIDATKNASGVSEGDAVNILHQVAQKQSDSAKELIDLVEQIDEKSKTNYVLFQTTIDAIFDAESTLNNSEPALGTALPAEVVGITNEVATSVSKLVASVSGKPENLIVHLGQVRHDLENLCRAGKASIANAPQEKAKGVLSSISKVCNAVVQMVQSIQLGQERGQLAKMKVQLRGDVKLITGSLGTVVDAAGKLVPDGYVDPNDPNVIAERELLSAANAIEAAARKLASLQKEERPRQANEDLNFEEQILEAAKAIAAATSALVRSATGVQREIVAKEKNNSDSVYHADGTWNDGLVSASKLVVGATNELCEAANQFVKGESQIEKVIVCSKSVSSCTVQLLSAAAVKSDPNSTRQIRLRAAGKAVTDATEQLVIASKNTRPVQETDNEMITPSSVHKNKIIEMELQMKILKLEKELEQARTQLASLRRERYNVQPKSPTKTPTGMASTPRTEIPADTAANTPSTTSNISSVKAARDAFAKRAAEQSRARPISVYKKKNL